MPQIPAALTVHKVWCYPVQFFTPTLRLPPVEYMADKEHTYVRFNGERLLINTLYLQKLVRSVVAMPCNKFKDRIIWRFIFIILTFHSVFNYINFKDWFIKP